MHAISNSPNLAESPSLTILEIGIVFVALGVLSWLALKLKISNVPLFLVAGLALG